MSDSDGWYWQKDDRSWQAYGSTNSVSSRTIETSYRRNPNCPIVFTCGGESYSLDLKAMTQTNCRTRKRRNVMWVYNGNKTTGTIQSAHSTADLQTTNAYQGRRVSQPVASPAQVALLNIYPPSWGSDDENFRLVPIGSSGSTVEEYRLVVHRFERTMPRGCVRSVTRVQNRLLYQRFHVCKMQLESRLGQGKGLRFLFHGTMKNHIGSICKQVFDCRLNSRHRYGKGSYFARDANYTSSFTDCNKMFLAEVSIFQMLRQQNIRTY